MSNVISEILKSDEYVDTVNYSGLSLPIYKSLTFDKYYTIIAGKYYVICDCSENFKEYLQDVIDLSAGLIKKFSEESYLVAFQNGKFLDMKLVHDHRIIKVYLVKDASAVDNDKLIKQAEIDLKTYLQAKLGKLEIIWQKI